MRLGWKTRVRFAICACFLVAAGAARAHPHVWVTVKTTVLIKEGTIVGLQQHWTFDEFYAAMAIEGLDKNGDGSYDRKELAELAQVNIDGMKDFKYFTFAKLRGSSLSFSAPVDYWLEYKNNKLTLHFTLPLATPVWADAKGFSFSVYDESFFIAFSLAKKSPIAFGGDAPAGCKASVGEDAADAQWLGSAFARQFGRANLGGSLGQAVAISCPAK